MEDMGVYGYTLFRTIPDLFCTEGSNVYACLDGIVESITDSPKGQG